MSIARQLQSGEVASCVVKSFVADKFEIKVSLSALPLTHSLYDRDSLIIVLNAVSGTVAKPSSFIDVNTKYRNIKYPSEKM